MTDPYVRIVGQVEDMYGYPLAVGVCGNTVILQGSLPLRFSTAQAEEFAQLYVRACLLVESQAGALTGAQRAELKAAAEEMCLADCGAPGHDQHCRPQPPERNRSQ